MNRWASTGTADNGNDLAFVQTFSSRWIHRAQQNLQPVVQVQSQRLPSARCCQLSQRLLHCWGSQSTRFLQRGYVPGPCSEQNRLLGAAAWLGPWGAASVQRKTGFSSLLSAEPLPCTSGRMGAGAKVGKRIVSQKLLQISISIRMFHKTLVLPTRYSSNRNKFGEV